MHIVPEEIVPVELGCILHELCVPDKVITFDTLNSELLLFCGKITVEKTHKPLQLNKLAEPAQGLSPTTKALQYLTLLQILYATDFSGFCVTNQLVLAIFVALVTHSRSYLRSQIYAAYMRSAVEDHLTQFVELYGDKPEADCDQQTP